MGIGADADMYDISPEVEARYWSEVDRSNPDGCWLWTGRINTHGYGYFEMPSSKGRLRVQANRIAHQLHNKFAASRVYPCKHEKTCVNPAHLRCADHVLITPEELPRIERERAELQRWMDRHRNKPRRGVKSGKELQDISR